MARAFSGSGQYLEYAGAAVNAYPVTFAAWVAPADFVTSYGVFSLGGAAAAASIDCVVEIGTQQFYCRAVGAGKTATTTLLTAGAWNHVAAIWGASNSRTVYHNAGGAGTTTTDIAWQAASATDIGRLVRASPGALFKGIIAEAGLWDTALTNTEVRELARGKSPKLVRPERLVAYWPLAGGPPSVEPDRVGRYPMTVVGATAAQHPPIIYPVERRRVYYVPAAGPVGNPWGYYAQQ